MAAALCLALGVCEAAQAQTSLAGTVVDAESGRPVPQALVRSIVGSLATETGPDGSFTLRGADIGDITLLVSRLGYHPLRVRIQLDAAGESLVRLEAPLQLRPLPLELRGLVVEAEDPWLERSFEGKGLYSRDRLVGRPEIERAGSDMGIFLNGVRGPERPDCDFELYLDGNRLPDWAVEREIASRAPVEFEAVEVYKANARMGARESPAAPFRGSPSVRSPTSGRDGGGLPCGVIRLWSLGHRVIGQRQYIGDMLPQLLGPLPAGMGEVRGRLGEDDGPLQGVLVSLMDEAPSPVAAAFTDAEGRFVLRASAPGVFYITGVAPGMEPWRSEAFELDPGDVIDLTPGGS